MADGDSSADGSADAKGEDRIGTSPSRLTDPVMREEMRRGLVWAGVIGLIALTVYISRSLLVVFGALVFAAMIDGGARLLGRILPIARAWRVALVLILSVLFFVWLGYFAGSTISNEAAQFPELVQGQISDLLAWAQGKGLQIDQSQLQNYAGSITSGIGTLTSALGCTVGASPRSVRSWRIIAVWQI